MIVIILRTLIIYTVVILSLRIMGKRQIGELQPAELVVAIIISDLAAIPMESVNIPLLSGIIPVFTLISAEVIVSYLSLKSKKIRKTKQKCLTEKAVLWYIDSRADRNGLFKVGIF